MITDALLSTTKVWTSATFWGARTTKRNNGASFGLCDKQQHRRRGRWNFSTLQKITMQRAQYDRDIKNGRKKKQNKYAQRMASNGFMDSMKFMMTTEVTLKLNKYYCKDLIMPN